jgi:hypothetical protein
MSDRISYRPNAETQGTTPLQVFETDGSTPPTGTKATPRPADRPRQVPPNT